MKTPVIGITASWKDAENGPMVQLDHGYVRCVEEAGGVALILAPQKQIAQLLSMIDGLLIPGGPDIDPKEYGQDKAPETNLVAHERYQFDKAMLTAADGRLPVMGICYGSQLINVHRGGDLIQHLPLKFGSDITHARSGTFVPHSVRILPKGRLQEIIREAEIESASSHHQCANRMGRGLVVTAESDDGVVEAFEDPKLPFFVGVQWHPEKTPEAEHTKRLFKAFVDSCR